MRKLSSLLLVVSSFAFVGCSEEEGTTLEDTGSPDTGSGDTGVATDSGTDTGTDTGTTTDSTVVDSTATDSTATDSTATDSTATDSKTDSTATDSTATDSSSTDSTSESGGDSATTKTKTVWALRVGDGTAVATGTSAPIFLAPFTIDYTAAPTGTAGTVVAAPVTGTDNVSLPISSSIGSLTSSGNGKLVSFAAYRAAPGVAAIPDTAASATKRVGVTLNAAGTFVVSDLGAGANDAGKSIRSAYTTDGGQFWISAEDKGVTYNVGTTVTSLAVGNVRWLGGFGGQLYVTSGSGSAALSGIAPGLVQVGTGFPTTTPTTPFTKVNGPVTGASPYGVAAFDTDATAGIDTILLCDSAKGLEKWRLESTTWTLKATHLASATGCVGLAAWVDGADLVAVVTTGETPPRIVALRDPIASTTAIATGSTVATAATNTVFKGVALAPSP